MIFEYTINGTLIEVLLLEGPADVDAILQLRYKVPGKASWRLCGPNTSTKILWGRLLQVAPAYEGHVEVVILHKTPFGAWLGTLFAWPRWVRHITWEDFYNGVR